MLPVSGRIRLLTASGRRNSARQCATKIINHTDSSIRCCSQPQQQTLTAATANCRRDFSKKKTAKTVHVK